MTNDFNIIARVRYKETRMKIGDYMPEFYWNVMPIHFPIEYNIGNFQIVTGFQFFPPDFQIYPKK